MGTGRAYIDASSSIYFQVKYFSEPDVIIKCIQYCLMTFYSAYVPHFPQELLQTPFGFQFSVFQYVDENKVSYTLHL